VATIQTPTGNYRDQGTASIGLWESHFPVPDHYYSALNENFLSILTQPILIVPTSKDECKDGGWSYFPQFENQGQCVSFVENGGDN
jgi:hypothetical protein